MLIPVQQICCSGVFFSTGKERRPSFALVIGESIDINFILKSVHVEMNVMWSDGVRKISKIIALKHLIRVKIRMVAVVSIAR